VQDVGQQALDVAAIALRLPKRLDALASRIEEGSLAVANPRLERRIARLERTSRRSASALVFAALLIAGAVVRPDDPVLGSVLMAGSVLPLLHGLWAGRRGL
jgi:hypothetical protein